MTWKKNLLFWEKMKTGTLFFLASEDSAVQSLNEMEHLDVTEKPVAAEDAVLVGFSTLLTWGIVNKHTTGFLWKLSLQIQDTAVAIIAFC